MALSKRTRFEVFKRDAFKCQYCGRTPPQVVLHADHVIPKSKGGQDHPANLVTSCVDCNLGKGPVPLDEIRQELDGQLAVAKERAAQLKAFNDFLVSEREKEDAEIQLLGRVWNNEVTGRRKNYYLFGPARVQSARMFLRRLPAERVREAMDTAIARVPATRKEDWHRWKYFCGVCWSMIRDAGRAR